MNTFACVLLVLALAGPSCSSTPSSPPTILVLDSLEDLKRDVAAALALKEAPPDEEAAIEFSSRALKLAKAAKDATTRTEAL